MHLLDILFPVCDVINFEINVSFPIKSFSYVTENGRRKIKKNFKKHFWTFWTVLEAVIGGFSPKVFVFFPKEDIFVALETDWSNSSSCSSFQIFCNIWSLMCENIYFSPEEICTLVQGILLALTPIGGSIFEFHDKKT